MIKLLIIIFVILVLIIIYLKLNQNNIESYTNANNVFSNNYIINGSFQGGQKIQNSNLIGNSKIIS